MKFYVDFDDCLCETGRYFCKLVSDLFGKNVPYEKMNFFDLKSSFSLPDEQYEHMMIVGHRSEELLSFEETPGASGVINRWMDVGHEVFIITGRPSSAYEASREWLDRHGLERVRLYCLNKYGRDRFIKNSTFSLELEDYYRMHFDFAVEDSPVAFQFFSHLPELNVMVFDRPWNQTCDFPGNNFIRCFSWDEVYGMVEEKTETTTV